MTIISGHVTTFGGRMSRSKSMGAGRLDARPPHSLHDEVGSRGPVDPRSALKPPADVPADLEDAALIDGCSYLGAVKQ